MTKRPHVRCYLMSRNEVANGSVAVNGKIIRVACLEMAVIFACLTSHVSPLKMATTSTLKRDPA